MKKILFLIQLPPPIHGASVVNKSIQDSELINQEFNTQYLNISPAKDLSDIGKLSFRKVFSFLKIYLSSVIIFFKFKPDLIYLTLSPHGLAFYKDGLIAVSLKTLGGKLVFHMHGKGIRNESINSWIKKNLYRLIFKGAHIIHLAESLFYDVEDVRDKSKTLTAVANGISLFDKELFNDKPDKFTFIYLSNLVRLKGADVLVRASGLIPAEHQNKFQLKIIGRKSNAQYAAEIERIIEKNPYNNIKLLGPKYGNEKNRELVSSHVFVLPTKNECFPLSILEAMAAGLAVISTNEGAISEIIEAGVTGEVIENCTPEALAAVMIKHIKNPAYSTLCANASKAKFEALYTKDVFERNLTSTLKLLVD